MLQISQIEKPRCSARIEKIRLRRAIALPLVSQNTASSGFQSEIQLEPRFIRSCPKPLWIGHFGHARPNPVKLDHPQRAVIDPQATERRCRRAIERPAFGTNKFPHCDAHGGAETSS